MLLQTKVMLKIESLMGIGVCPDLAGDQSHLMSISFLCTEDVRGANQWNIPAARVPRQGSLAKCSETAWWVEGSTEGAICPNRQVDCRKE